ncbi:unnamed protein product [marine sediment metagenome]|uniref:Uncharacterized protein n=1 Tax=marine sediment metagenome TaxID=412755 RepID=X1C726_9ZZZZ
MPKCPKCKADIDHLHFYETKHYDSEVEMVDGRLVHSNEGIYSEGKSYDCPKCDEELCCDDDRAIELLKGG